ncbi:WD and tetratricopeptide repeats protein 1-like [Clytia hemisphaerica]|uniref:WD and tetratricopeptide repeats protein 1 n=1 Tax=Clytia hemisphaerica TaxID=252671 RepID=A0A7M5X117_9CNID
MNKKYDVNFTTLCQKREIQSGLFNRKFQKALQINLPFVQRLGLQDELQGHTGCVNCLEWSGCGEYLASGSDDFNVIIWNVFQQKAKHVLPTRHDGNIFTVKFLPASNNNIVVTGAADACLKTHDVPSSRTIQNFYCHSRRIKRLAVCDSSPSMIWSASEDGTVREFDLRSPHKCSSESPCRNVLVNLKTQSVPNKEVKCIQLHPHFPELFAVGATDPFVRLYDRRNMNLSELSNDIRTDDKSGCVSYLSPGHLPNRKTRRRPNKYRHYTSTYIQFSPDGREILQNLGGEHIYLYEYNKKKKPVIFTSQGEANDHDTIKQHNIHRCGNGLNSTYEMRSRSRYEHDMIHDTPCDKATSLKQKGNDYFSNENFFQAVVYYNKAIALSPNSSVLYANRAAALLKRKWDGDIYGALRDCQTAIQLDPTHSKAYYRQAKCLFELQWIEEASLCIETFKEKFSEQSNSYSLKMLERDIEQHLTRRAETESESESEIFHRNPSRLESYHQLNAFDYHQRFVGSCNTTTDIKEANFFGDNGQYIVAGSDCGCMLLWDRTTTNLIEAWQGDESIVNCVQPHPSSCLVATSGLDPVVRLWSPRPVDEDYVDSRSKEVEVLVRTNQKRMNTDPLEEMLRTMGYHAFRDDEDGQDDSDVEGDDDQPTQCRTS